MGNYDSWKTTPPDFFDDIEAADREGGCECRHRVGDYEWCPVHGKGIPDEALENQRERHEQVE